MLKKTALAIHGGKLSNTSKMPGRSTGLDPRGCGVGSKLRAVKGSTCEKCYAFSGMYSLFYRKTLRDSWAKRAEGLKQPQWVEAMAKLIKPEPEFRWHDAGDVQGWQHLVRIMAVAALTPDTKHWLPTREYALIATYRKLGGFIPDNVVIRLSAPMVGAVMTTAHQSSMVLTKGQQTPDGVHKCPASSQQNQCNTCRACWDKTVPVVAYPIH
jgi:hypothetical protein